MATRILFISGSIGLGHAIRDLAIAKSLRERCPGVEIAWLAASPASRAIADAGEKLLPEAADIVDESAVAEAAARGAGLNLVRYAFAARRSWSRNIDVFERVTARERFDLVIGDETYEVALAMRRNPRLKTCPFVMIYDFVGFDPLSNNPLERLGVYLWNRTWSGGRRPRTPPYDLALFVGEEEDVPDRPFGFMLPNRRAWARERYRFIGYVFPFDPGSFGERSAVRARLGYGAEPLVVCSIGGTAVGRRLLDLCASAFPIARRNIPDLRMVLVAGPRLSPDSISAPGGAEVRGYVPALHEHFAAADLVVVQGGGTTTLELTALRRPFIYFPLEGHSEQEVAVTGRLERHGAGVRMTLSKTSPGDLANAILGTIGAAPAYPPIPADGAGQAADLLCALLSSSEDARARG